MSYYSSYLILIPGILLMFWAQNQIRSTYQRYAQIPSSMGMTGAEVARTILYQMGITDISIEPVSGELTDHYDPNAKAVRLSEGIYNSSSLAAAAVAAHECGHVLQDKQGYRFMNLRANLVPVANLGSQFGPMLVILGLFISGLGTISSLVINLGIALFVGAIAFHVVTLPVEFDASGRALKLIDQLGILQGQENRAAKAVLQAAAWTYVATALYSVLQLAQLLLISRDR
ncbi:zinc metallopeptidase [Roseofilum sp. BLCC_M154]|jgi:Zn-dependent membrane protease YugP|uniref:Zinc metallopeptidase n=1 Tax=Roseofilum acuticapitatum BLCC-M154 TaxID=3022444 RepID=A0ABT7AVN4_9CYAN|nr:zinc metallopeptidase [Roseofilum acuticapitatum]MDJ1170632.1 zinc metallopeptidase [Roseofilum acuticapitatum BLCC-M154]